MSFRPIFIIDDDSDDQEFIIESWKELGYENELLFLEMENLF